MRNIIKIKHEEECILSILEDLKTVQKARDDIKSAIESIGGGN